MNEGWESALRESHEALKIVVEFEDFSTCRQSDMLKAKGLVPEIRRVINVKDSFTRMSIEPIKERPPALWIISLLKSLRQVKFP